LSAYFPLLHFDQSAQTALPADAATFPLLQLLQDDLALADVRALDEHESTQEFSPVGEVWGVESRLNSKDALPV
jgi:hypothetical protein